jgi:alkylation response protein AidB-like acyl-CoA dehydrogenase
MTGFLDERLARWLATHADELDSTNAQAGNLLPLLAASGLPAVGVPQTEGGAGGPLSAAVAVVAELAEHSLSAAFVFWAQRAAIECLLHSPNRPLAQRLLPSLLDGTLAGAPGLSNAMKFLGGLDEMRLRFTAGPGNYTLNGTVQWATNLRAQGFVLCAAARNEQTGDVAVFAIPRETAGVARGADFDLIGLRGSNTAAVGLTDVALDDSWHLHPDAKVFLPRVRPALLALQCGLGLGLARASLRAVSESAPGSPPVLQAELRALQESVAQYWLELSTGIDDGRLNARPQEIVSLRLRMVELAMSSVQLELQALGGRAYLHGSAAGFTRRWREAAFLPIVTPTALQLKTELNKLTTNDAPGGVR